MQRMQTTLLFLGALTMLGTIAPQSTAQPAGRTLLPHASWDCGMPDGIPHPEAGKPVFEIALALDRAEPLGRTQYGERSVAVGGNGTVRGARLEADVMPGALDLELKLANGAIEIEQVFVLRATDGSYIYLRNAGAGPNANDVRIVLDFEAPNASAHAWLNTGKFIARRQLDAKAKTLTLRVYDVAGVAVNKADALAITKPAGVPAQPWNYRTKDANEQPGAVLIKENVTLAPSQSVGQSKRGNRNIIPITGGELSGKITGKVLPGGADYQLLTPPATIDAHYLWQTDDGEIIIVRNGGGMGGLVPTFEARVDGRYAFLNTQRYLSGNPSMGQGGVALTFFESVDRAP